MFQKFENSLALKIQLGKNVLIIPIPAPWNEKKDEQVKPMLDDPIDNLTAYLHTRREELSKSK